MKKIKKEDKIKELEQRILTLESVIRQIPIVTKDTYFPQINHSIFYCRWCGGYVTYCPGHSIC